MVPVAQRGRLGFCVRQRRDHRAYQAIPQHRWQLLAQPLLMGKQRLQPGQEVGRLTPVQPEGVNQAAPGQCHGFGVRPGRKVCPAVDQLAPGERRIGLRPAAGSPESQAGFGCKQGVGNPAQALGQPVGLAHLQQFQRQRPVRFAAQRLCPGRAGLIERPLVGLRPGQLLQP